jgi:hypothetical protein
MRDLHISIIGKLPIKPTSNLLGRPVLLELIGNNLAELRERCESARLGPNRPLPGFLVRVSRPIFFSTTVSINLATNG